MYEVYIISYDIYKTICVLCNTILLLLYIQETRVVPCFVWFLGFFVFQGWFKSKSVYSSVAAVV